MKNIILFIAVIFILTSCKDDINKSEISIKIIESENEIFRVNEESGESILYQSKKRGEGIVYGEFNNGIKDGLWKYENIKGHFFDSIVLYSVGERKGVLKIIYSRDYTDLSDGWYLFSYKNPYKGVVSYSEYGYIKLGNKNGIWSESIDWSSFSSSPIQELHRGEFLDGHKDGKWLTKFTEINHSNQGVENLMTISYYLKIYNKDTLTSIGGFLVGDSLDIDEINYYSFDKCLLKTERFKNGFKNGEEEYFDCSYDENNLILVKNYKNGKKHGKALRYLFGKKIDR